MFSARSVQRLAVLLLLLGTTNVLAQSRASSSAPNPVQETGYWVKAGPTHRLVDWIDNNRIIFVGGPFEGWDHNKINPTAIYTYDISSTTVTKLADGITYCFKPHEIRYTLKQSADAVVVRTFKRKESNSETEVTRSRAEIEAEGQKSKALGLKPHPLQCGGYNPQELAGGNWEQYRLIGVFPLLDGHGYLDIFGRHPNFKEPPFDTEPVRWFPSNGGTPINLPMPKRAISRIDYSEWNNMYVMRGWSGRAPPLYEPPAKNERWPKGVGLPVWLLRPNGVTEKQEIPYSNWIESYNRLFPTRAGFLVTRDVNSKEAGVYLVVKSELVRLVVGSTVGVAVSPDGCKVAVAITTDFNNRNGGLKVVNVCEAKGR